MSTLEKWNIFESEAVLAKREFVLLSISRILLSIYPSFFTHPIYFCDPYHYCQRFTVFENCKKVSFSNFSSEASYVYSKESVR